MAEKQWTLHANGERHQVTIRWNRWTEAGEIIVDGEVADTWGYGSNRNGRQFSVAGREATVYWHGIVEPFTKCTLYLEGDRVRER